VIILSDDQAWTDYGFMGNMDIKAPHLDELAARSLVFERGYVFGMEFVLAGLYMSMMSMGSVVTVARIDGNFVWLSGVSPVYLAPLPEFESPSVRALGSASF
jgi:hypothetical protein